MIKHYINFHKLLNYRYKEDNIMAINKRTRNKNEENTLNWNEKSYEITFDLEDLKETIRRKEKACSYFKTHKKWILKNIGWRHELIIEKSF